MLTKSILLLTENSNVNNLSLEKNSYTKIISFDFKTHLKLKKLQIEHEFVESYLDSSDGELIENAVYEKFINWHKEEWVSDYIYLDDLNLGSLLDQFIGLYFLRILKKFVCVKRIFEKEHPELVCVSEDLVKIVSVLSESKSLKIESIPGKKQSALYYDQIQVPLKIGSKSFSIWISRKNFLRIKNLFEKLSIKIFNLKPSLKKKNQPKAVLLLDFNTILDGDFISELSTIDENVILLNQRKPAIWNMESFKKIRRSKSKISRLSDFQNKTTENDITKINTIIHQNIKKLQSKTEFELFFSFEGKSLWPIIREEFFSMCSKYFIEAGSRYKLSEQLFETLNIKSLLILYPNAAEEKVIIHVAKKLNIHGIILQHGIPPHTKYFEKFAPLWYPKEQNHLTHAIWDNNEKKYLRKLGIEEKNFVLTGSHRLDSLFKIQNASENMGNLLVASSTLAKQDEISDSSTSTSIEYANMLKNICKISNDIKDQNLIVKLHPAQSPTFDAKNIIREVDESIPIYQHENISNFLKNCDVLICMEYSTILLEAMILKKPTITILTYSDWFKDDPMMTSGATLTVKTIEEFELNLKKILNDKNFRYKLIEKGNNYVKNFLTHQGNASNSIKKLLNF